VKHFVSSFACVAVALVAVFSAKPSQAEKLEPAVVVSVANVQEVLDDVLFLTKAAGQGDSGKLVALMAPGFTVGLDKSEPIGFYLTFDGQDPVPVSFVPVTDLKKTLATYKAQIGEPRDVGDGVLELEGDSGTYYVKQKGKYAFVAQDKIYLTDLPESPAKLLGGLDKKYTIAASIHVQRIPKELRDMAINEIRSSYERTIENQAEEDELQQKMAEAYMDSVSDLIEDSDEITFGWEIDEAKGTTFMDISMTALEGTKLARSAATMRDTKTDFFGFLSDDEAMSMNLTGTMTKDDIEQLTTMLSQWRAGVLEEIENSDEIDTEDIQEAKRLIEEAFDVFQDTVDSGKMDAGSLVVLNGDDMTFLAGGYVANGKKLDRAFRDLVELAKKDPEFPKTKFDVGKHGDVTFHSMTAPIPEDEEDARDVFGDSIDVIVGIGGESFYVAVGEDGQAKLKKAIDRSKAAPGKKVLPMQMRVSVGDIIEYVERFDDSGFAEAALEELDNVGDNDHILISTEPVERGSKTRFEIQQGVLTLIGAGAAAVAGQ